MEILLQCVLYFTLFLFNLFLFGHFSAPLIAFYQNKLLLFNRNHKDITMTQNRCRDLDIKLTVDGKS